MADRCVKILYIHSSADLYGSDVCLLNMIRALPDRVDPVVLLPEQGPLTERLRATRADVRHIPLPVPRRYYFSPRRLHRLFWLGYETFSSWQKLRRIIRSEAIDLVHINVSVLLFPAWVAHACGKPVIVHTREIFRPTRYSRLIIRLIERYSDVIACVSRAVQDQFSRKNKTVVLYDGLSPKEDNNPNPLTRADFGVSEHTFCVGAIGRINEWKGHDDFIRAARHVLARFPDTKFFIVGDVYKNNFGLRDGLIRLAEELGIREQIILTGFRYDADCILDLFDVFVLPSKLPEPFGMVLLEAMQKGKPVVATAHGGPLDIVLPGETGILVPPSDPRGMARAIIDLLGDSALRKKMGRKGQERVRMSFQQDHFMRDLLTVYDRLVQQ